ncbi:MAG: sugar phosphate isomerase/epimerase family protein [Candidatus Hydrogenedentales bacterium]
MKTGINLLLWTAAATEEHVPLLERIKGWGYDGVEFPMFAPDASPWDRLAAVSDDLGLSRSVVAVLPQDMSLLAETPQDRARAVEQLKATLDSCLELGATMLGGPIYHPVGKLVGRGPTDEERKRAVEGLQKVGEYAHALGISVAVEPLNRFESYFLSSQAEAATLVDAVKNPAVGVLYDTFHANIEEKDPVGTIGMLGARIKHVHVSANDRATPGEDHIDWVATFDALKAVGYDGWLMIEAFGAWLPEVAAATCIWRKMAPSEEHLAKEGLAFMKRTWTGKADRVKEKVK